MARAKILVAEDDEDVGAYIKKYLERAGFSVVAVVTTAEQAVAAAKSSTPDLVLMEITLPGNMDGVDAAGQIRSQLSIPVVYLASSADEKTQERAKATKPLGLLRKPFNGCELQMTLDRAVRMTAASVTSFTR
jgi:CheY-like chemotaxis protein